MRKIILTLIVSTLLQSISSSQIKVKIDVTSNSVKENENIFIAGNLPQFGEWSPNKVPLMKVDAFLWSMTFELNKGDFIEFKFTKGDWNSEALTDDKLVPSNHKLTVANDTTLYFKINYWKDEYKINIPDTITGKFVHFKNFDAKEIQDRDIIVWLPPDYNPFDGKRYPVLYMHDGQNIFNPATSSLGFDWRIDEIADSLIRINEIPSLIVVGIYNSGRRFYEYSNTAEGKKYAQFLVNELKPFVDNNFKTLPDRNNTFVAGSSMGGLISFILGWEYPEIFSRMICVSPAFKIRNVDYVSAVKEYSGAKKDLKIYIDNGGLGLEAELQNGIDEMLEALSAKGYKLNYDILWIKDSNAEHNEIAWSKRAPIFLKFLFDKI
uniref:Histidine kinase n=1 Tax=Ignavibacterium album TaxID=591197 RepID=A0A7V2ZJD4_9BACT